MDIKKVVDGILETHYGDLDRGEAAREAKARFTEAVSDMLNKLEEIQDDLKTAWSKAHYEETRLATYKLRDAIVLIKELRESFWE